MAIYDVYTDAGKYGDLAVVIYKEESELFRDSLKRDVKKSHNEYEYHAVIYALEECLPQLVQNWHDGDLVKLHSDSQLIVNQINGKYKCESEKLLRCKTQMLDLQKDYATRNIDLEFIWIPRERNPAGWILESKKKFKVRNDLLDHTVTYQVIKDRIEKFRKEGKESFTVKELLRET